MNNSHLDQARSVRKGEELNIHAVDLWLKDNIPNLDGEPQVTQYAGGASNWTYCIEYPQQALILRRGPTGTKAKGAHNMEREYRLQSALHPFYHYVPKMLCFCDDPNILDTDFYVMEKITGIIPRHNLPKDLTITTEQTKRLCLNVLDCLIELHQVDHQAANLSHLGKGAGYTERQIHGWTERYQKAKTWNVPAAKGVINWLATNMPATEHICLTHNDFRLDNVVLDPNDCTKVIGILDWELATLGDPLMDLGNSLAYWVEADDDFLAQRTRRQPTHLPGMLTRQEVIRYYCTKMSIETAEFTFYQVYGLFRLAGIAQQIYYRYHHGQTNNPAFKHFWLFVHYLIHRCKKAIRQQGKTR